MNKRWVVLFQDYQLVILENEQDGQKVPLVLCFANRSDRFLSRLDETIRRLSLWPSTASDAGTIGALAYASGMAAGRPIEWIVSL
jgi:hypothetical protein